MDKRGQIDFDVEFFVCLGMGLLCGLLAMYIMRGSGAGTFWKIMTLPLGGVIGFFITQIIINR